MSHSNGRRSTSRSAKRRGQMRKIRRHRAERREATKDIREAHNKKMKAEGHPGWAGDSFDGWLD